MGVENDGVMNSNLRKVRDTEVSARPMERRSMCVGLVVVAGCGPSSIVRSFVREERGVSAMMCVLARVQKKNKERIERDIPCGSCTGSLIRVC